LRAREGGACGVMVLANIAEQPLTDAAFATIWKAIDARSCRCSCIRRRRPASREMAMTEFQLTASIGFTFDTSLAVSRMIFDGFFDRYPS
jgi:aminocarboxymuconate-semialdehyde decarboxylase